MASSSTSAATPIDRKDADALTRSMTVLPEFNRAAGADALSEVVSDSGSAYLVDALEGRCECPDHYYREARCIHIRRVAFATGERAVPAWADRDRVDDHLGLHCDGGPRFAADELEADR